MKALYFTKYSRNAGSSRLRSYQYFPFLKEQGMAIEVSPLFSERYLTNLYAGRSTKAEALKGYLRRFFKLFSVGKYDKLVIEKELFPYLPAWGEYILSAFGIKYIVDYDDAVFHNYDQHPNRWIRKFLGDKIDWVMRYSTHVIAGNRYLADRARRAGANNIFIIPTVIDIDRYPIKVWDNTSDKLIVGWVGTKSTFEKHFMLLADQVKRLTEANPNLFFHIIGAPDNRRFNEQVKFIPWSEDTEVEEILKFDVGLMPLVDSEWEKGKCAYKLIQYMACGIPGIASAVGANMEVVNEANGFLVGDIRSFSDVIAHVVADPQFLKERGAQAREFIQQKYTLQVQQERLLELIRS
ncbi:glycosyltransferase family 4 protein [Sphingobacterium sp. SGG-5]|uniref:glycosyltransferase family 4 protein n=1 Tax=Sphingobacterium sp. SGG-5 TaxID=2710881 RepID=UPI0013EB8444|nr:glycosyltransferase family 4 protein [Sphingobacterium sp. SGG-5]NGM63419.1 glycosyltransferase family 4 protein [Sphingobacterium sp. SGG-5]